MSRLLTDIPVLNSYKKMMSKKENTRICPAEWAGGLDNSIRRLLQNPKKIVKPYINKGMTVLDLGCGPGFFSIEIAKILDDSGKVIAADLQEGMLDRVRQKIRLTRLEQRIELHKCQNDTIGVTEKVDFVLLFYMIHEVPDTERLLKELISILKPNGKIFIVEPKIHVSKGSFENMIDKSKRLGLEIEERPKVFFSRSIVLTKNSK
jgi:ubiquinone/menaquinone biosynthesis C-methylase UbiE